MRQFFVMECVVVAAVTACGGEAKIQLPQDTTPPSLALATPADTSDNVALNTPIQMKFNEKVVLGVGGGIRLTRQGASIGGTTAISSDSLTLTFTPAGGLSPNAIYKVGFTGVTDVATNPVPTGTGTCFVTTPLGATATMSFTDAANDTIYHGGSNPSLLPPNLVAARLAREGTLFSGVFRFIGPRVFSSTALNQGLLILELDTDRDSTTGFWTIKDTLFFASDSLGSNYASMFASGTKAEYIIDLEPTIEVHDSAFVGLKESAFGAFIDGTFLPGVCGSMTGFVLPFSIIGDDDGLMNAVAMGVASTATPSAILVDPMPLKGFLAVDVRTPGPAPAWNGAPFVAPGQHRRVPIRRRPIPLR